MRHQLRTRDANLMPAHLRTGRRRRWGCQTVVLSCPYQLRFVLAPPNCPPPCPPPSQVNATLADAVEVAIKRAVLSPDYMRPAWRVGTGAGLPGLAFKAEEHSGGATWCLPVLPRSLCSRASAQ